LCVYTYVWWVSQGYPIDSGPNSLPLPTLRNLVTLLTLLTLPTIYPADSDDPAYPAKPANPADSARLRYLVQAHDPPSLQTT
jgi:hypothetical protein